MKASRGVVVVLMALLALLSLVGTCDRSRIPRALVGALVL